MHTTSVIESNWRETQLRATQQIQVHDLCATGRPVIIKVGDTEWKGRLVAYATPVSTPVSYAQKPESFLSLLDEQSKGLTTLPWKIVDRLEWSELPPLKPDAAVSKIVGLVAKALVHPQPENTTAALVDAMNDSNEVSNKFGGHLGGNSIQAVLHCRVLSEYIRRGNLELATKLYQEVGITQLRSPYPWAHFDFSFTVLSLIKAGIITEERMTKAEQNAVAFAMRETEPANLQKLGGDISHREFAATHVLLEDPKVQQLFKRVRAAL